MRSRVIVEQLFVVKHFADLTAPVCTVTGPLPTVTGRYRPLPIARPSLTLASNRSPVPSGYISLSCLFDMYIYINRYCLQFIGLDILPRGHVLWIQSIYTYIIRTSHSFCERPPTKKTVAHEHVVVQLRGSCSLDPLAIPVDRGQTAKASCSDLPPATIRSLFHVEGLVLIIGGTSKVFRAAASPRALSVTLLP